MNALQQKFYTIDEYLEKEVRSEEPNEYFDGKIVRRKDVQITQALIATNIMVGIHIALGNIEYTKLRVVGSGMLTYIPQFNFIVYPGAALVFQQPQFLTPAQNVLLNPVLIVEVGSASDILYNHSSRFAYYKTIPSLCEHVFIEQDIPYVTSLYKTVETTWSSTEATQLDQSIFLRSINCNIDLKEIYRHVEFTKPV